jgi:hypothetical protein
MTAIVRIMDRCLYVSVALFFAVGCAEHKESALKELPTIQYIVVQSYDDLTKYFDRHYNMPTIDSVFTQDDFSAEFYKAHDIIIAHMQSVGTVAEGSGDADFSVYRYVDVSRNITVVVDKYGPEIIKAVLAAHAEMPEEYVINFDMHPAYASIFRDGRVFGYPGDPERRAEGRMILRKLGFPQE